MIKAYSRRKLSRPGSHRRALLRNLSSALIMNEKITTTLPKAKELRRFIEKLITIAKAGKSVSYTRIRRDIDDRRVIRKLYDVITQRYNNRHGGYTRIFNIGYRKGDSASIAIIKLIQ